MSRTTSTESRKVRGSLATKLTLFIGGSIVVFMVIFSLVLYRFVSEAMVEALKVTAYESARAAAQADIEAWDHYFATPYQGWTTAAINQKRVGYRNEAELEQAFLSPEEKQIRERNKARFARFIEGDGVILRAECFFEDPEGQVERDGKRYHVRASHAGEATYRGSSASRTQFAGGAAEQGLLTIGGFTHSVIRGSHLVEDRLGEPAGEVAVYIAANSVQESTDALMLQVGYATLGFIALGALIAQFVGRQVTRPLKLLQDDIRIVASGDLEHQTRAHSSDEIGELARTFDRMTHSLAEAAETERAAARTQKQVHVAAEVTASLLPTELTAPAGYDLAAHHENAGELGGELYDVLPMAGGRTGFVLAKASGTGVPAAILMGMARSSLRAVARGTSDPGEALRQVNEMLSGDMRRGMYVAVMLVSLDPETGALDIANAGHAPLLLYRKELDKVITVHSEGIALGFDAGPVFDKTLVVRTMDLEVGDRAVLAGDGVGKLRGENGAELGEARLVGLVKREAGHPADAFIKRVVGTLEKYRGRRELEDDITLLTVGRSEGGAA